MGLVTVLCITVSALPQITGRDPKARETSAVGIDKRGISAAGNNSRAISGISDRGVSGINDREISGIDHREIGEIGNREIRAVGINNRGMIDMVSGQVAVGLVTLLCSIVSAMLQITGWGSNEDECSRN